MKTKLKPCAYPVTVDAKELSALMMCGDAIIRNPKKNRIELWNKIKKTIQLQVEEDLSHRTGSDPALRRRLRRLVREWEREGWWWQHNCAETLKQAMENTK